MSTNRVDRRRDRLDRLSVLQASREATAAYSLGSALACVGNASTGSVARSFEPRGRLDLDRMQAPVTISHDEVDTLLAELRSRWDEEQQSDLLAHCRSAVLSSIAGPFGLGRVVAGWDQAGGNVTTQHNANEGVFARREENYRGADYRGSKYQSARDRKKDAAIIENTGQVRDEYSGELLDFSEVDCDHIVATETYHRASGWRQSKAARAEFGADPDNLALTASSGNRSMQSEDKHAWQDRPNRQKPGQSNKEIHAHDNRRVNPAIKRGQGAAERHADSPRAKACYDATRLATTGAFEAGKLGVQQSLGLLLTEFFAASFDEIGDAWHHGFRHGVQANGFAGALRTRLGHIAERVASRWKSALTSLGGGFVSGFLSNLVTWLVNMVVTTGKRMVRLIREGLLSILKALKMALLPPTGMSSAEAGDAAVKLLASGAMLSLGIALEEVVEKGVASFPLLAPFAPMVATVLVGAGSGIATALLVAGLDRLDLFGVRDQARKAAVLATLGAQIAAEDQAIRHLYEDEVGRLSCGIRALRTA